MSDTDVWLKNPRREQEVLDWISSQGWDPQQIIQWASGYQKFTGSENIPGVGVKENFVTDPLKLDSLKDWIDGKYTLDDVISWRFFPADHDLQVQTMLKIVYAWRKDVVSADGGTIDFIGIDSNGNAHIALANQELEADAAGCSACPSRGETIENITRVAEQRGIAGVIDDGPVAAVNANHRYADRYTGANGSGVASGSLDPVAPTTSVPEARTRRLGLGRRS